MPARDPRSTSSSAPPGFTFNITTGPWEGKQLTFGGVSKFRVGRTKASSIQIKDPAVSEKHAEILFLDGSWQIKDLGSSNGTTLNGTEVTDQYVKLKSGDVIRFGTETTLTLDMASDAPPAAVPAPAPPTTTAPDTTTMTTTTGKPTTATVTETEPEMDMATDALTVQQFLEAECVRLEQHIRSHAEELGAGVQRTWQEEKRQLQALYTAS